MWCKRITYPKLEKISVEQNTRGLARLFVRDQKETRQKRAKEQHQGFQRGPPP